MTSFDIPADFLKSCREYDAYPRKLVSRERYGQPMLALAKDRLDKQKKRLNLFDTSGKTAIPYRNISRDGAVTQMKLNSEEGLQRWLGGVYAADPEKQGDASGAKEDPACRFIFLVTNGATAPLQLTPGGLSRMLSYFQVMPNFLDYLYVFGGKHGEDRERRFSAFRSENDCLTPDPNLRIPALNRTGKRFQMCYNLKTINLKSTKETEDGDVEDWKIRQAAFHHQFDVEAMTQLWIVAEPQRDFRTLIADRFHEERNHRAKFESFEQAFETSLGVHLACARWANEEWRWYIHYLERLVDESTRQVIIRDKALVVWKSGLLGTVQEYEEKAIEVVMALESNREILIRLRAFYNELADKGLPESERRAAGSIIRQFVARVDELMSDLQTQISRVHVLEKNVADRKTILIQHLQGQTADRAEKVAAIMQNQAERSELEAIAVRIITVIALFYLPATFVGTIFSTDIVKYDPPDNTGEEKLSDLALGRYFQVSIPLMFLTFLGAVGWYFYERSRIRRKVKQQKAGIECDVV